MRKTRNSTEACQTASCFMTSDLRHRQSFLNYLRKCDCINVLSHCCLSECPADFLVFVGSKEIHPCRKIANKQADSQTHGGNQALTDNPAFTFLKNNLCFRLLSYPQVKVMVRVCPVSQSDAAESSSFLKVDPRKKQITIMDPSANQTQSAASQKRAGANQVPPKMFTFDAAFPPDASQVRDILCDKVW